MSDETNAKKKYVKYDVGGRLLEDNMNRPRERLLENFRCVRGIKRSADPDGEYTRQTKGLDDMALYDYHIQHMKKKLKVRARVS